VLAAPAAEVVFAIGQARASAGGESRPLRKGDRLDEGETVSTGPGGRLQLRFKDGAFVALQPESSLRIDRYRQVEKGDAEDSVGMSFLRGGLRTLSGAVGKKDPKAYRMDSPVATIGIRGTGYTLFFDRSLVGRVGEGAIRVCNRSGCLDANAGEGFEVPSPAVRPERYVELRELPGREGFQSSWRGAKHALQAGRPGTSSIPIDSLPAGVNADARTGPLRFSLPPGRVSP